MSLADRLRRSVSGELRNAVGDVFSVGTLRDGLAAAVNAGAESFRQKSARSLADTPEVNRAGSRIAQERIILFFSRWGLPIAVVAVVLFVLWRKK